MLSIYLPFEAPHTVNTILLNPKFSESLYSSTWGELTHLKIFAQAMYYYSLKWGHDLVGIGANRFLWAWFNRGLANRVSVDFNFLNLVTIPGLHWIFGRVVSPFGRTQQGPDLLYPQTPHNVAENCSAANTTLFNFPHNYYLEHGREGADEVTSLDQRYLCPSSGNRMVLCNVWLLKVSWTRGGVLWIFPHIIMVLSIFPAQQLYVPGTHSTTIPVNLPLNKFTRQLPSKLGHSRF